MFAVHRTMLTIDGAGLKFGGRTTLAKLSPEGRLDIETNEGRILTLLGAAYGGQVPDWVLLKLKNAAVKWNTGHQSLAAGLLTEMRLRDVSADPEAVERLSKVEQAFDSGIVSDRFIDDCRKTFNPGEARDWHGRWTTGGNSGNSSSANARSGTSQGSARVIPIADRPESDAAAVPAQGNSGLDVDAAVAHLNDNAASHDQGSSGNCARYVENALAAGGVNVPPGPRSAKDKGPSLEAAGLTPVPSQDYVPQKGDVAVIQPYVGERRQDGHMAMFNGNEWVSDFHQAHGTDPYPAPGYRTARPPIRCSLSRLKWQSS